MFEKIKKLFHRFWNWLFYIPEKDNMYCIPCKWVFAGHVYIDAPNVETAKAYVRAHNIPPELEECVCYSMVADVNHPVLCTCGNCGTEYVVSAIHNPQMCPKCGNGSEDR